MRIARSISVLALIAAASALPAQQASQAAKPHARKKASLQSQAKITGDSARVIALARVPNSTVKSMELEREKGMLVYSFDLTVAGKSGVDEVWVNARTGKVVSVEHETPKMERAEAKKDAKEMKKP